MENKINIAELLKDCPPGMELNCTMYDGVTLHSVDDRDYIIFPIRVVRKDGSVIELTKYGQYADADYAKCVIFPKGIETWEEFELPIKFEDGEILVHTQNQRFIMSICHKRINESLLKTHCILWDRDEGLSVNQEICWYKDSIRLATEEEKQKLFDVIKANGYHWNEKTKTLEKLVEPKFKVGDTITDGEDSFTIDYMDNECYYDIKVNTISRLFIKYQDNWELVPNEIEPKFKAGDKIRSEHFLEERTIKTCEEDGYWTTVDSWIKISDQDDWELVPDKIEPKFKVGDKVKDKNNRVWFIVQVSEKHFDISSVPNAEGYFVPIEDQDDYELVPDKFDISTLVPFESKVLVRNYNTNIWKPAIFGGYIDDYREIHRYIVVGGSYYKCLIPYEGNEHLRCKTDNCDEYYKIWEK